MSSKKEWSKSEITNLIHIYEKKPVLWNTKDINYRNRETKSKIFEEIATNFGCSVEEIQRKIHNLRNQMSQELKKLKKKKNGSGTDESYTSNWPYFRALQFMIPIISAVPTQFSYTEAAMPIGEKITEKQENRTEEPVKEELVQKKRKREHLEEDIYKTALQTLQQKPDEYDKFGQYVALELRSLRTDFLRAKLKSGIRKIIDRIADEDLYSSSSTSASGASPSFSSPALQSEAESQTCRDFVHSFTHSDM